LSQRNITDNQHQEYYKEQSSNAIIHVIPNGDFLHVVQKTM
jgi:hypothetical protein